MARGDLARTLAHIVNRGLTGHEAHGHFEPILPVAAQQRYGISRIPPTTSVRSLLGGPIVQPTPFMPKNFGDPGMAATQAAIAGVHPDVNLKRWYGPELWKQIDQLATEKIRSGENAPSPEDLTNLIVGAATLGGGLYLKSALKGGELAAEAATAAPEATAAGEVAQASKIAQVAKGIGSVPLRHPFLASGGATVGAELPGAVRTGNPAQLLHGITGAGALAGMLGGAGGGIRGLGGGIVGNALADAVELPAQVLPSLYLTAKAGGQLAEGDSAGAKDLLHQWGQTSFIPALLRGNIPEALEHAGEHPLYALLEGAGVKSGIGHAITQGQRFAGVEAAAAGRRPPDLQVYGNNFIQRDPYSPDYFKRRRVEKRDAKRAAGDVGAQEVKAEGAVDAPDQLLGPRRPFVYDSEANRVYLGPYGATHAQLPIWQQLRNAEKEGIHQGEIQTTPQEGSSFLYGGTWDQPVNPAGVRGALESLVGPLNTYSPETGWAHEPLPLRATPAEIKSYLKSSVDRGVYASEGARKADKEAIQAAFHDLLPGGLRSLLSGDRGAELRLAVEGTISRDPHQAIVDLESYRHNLIAEQAHLPSSQLKANRRLVKAIGKAISDGDTSNLNDFVNRFMDIQRPQQEYIAKRGLLDPAQQAKAAAIPYARQYMEAKYGLSNEDTLRLSALHSKMKEHEFGSPEFTLLTSQANRIRARAQVIDKGGNPLSTEQIHAHMREGGLDPESVGYISQHLPRPEGEAPPPGTFYAPPNQAPSIFSKKRTGEATARGTYEGSVDAAVEQLMKTSSIVHRLKGFESMMDRLGLVHSSGKHFKNSSEAADYIAHPEDFGDAPLPDIPGGWGVVRTRPTFATKRSLEAAKDIAQENRNKPGETPQTAEFDTTSGETFAGEIIAKAIEPGDGPTVIVPNIVIKRLSDHYARITSVEKAGQALTGAFKGAVLPTSISWLAGNVIDNWIIRTLGTGISPGEIRSGKAFARLAKEHLSPDEASRALESMVGGSLYSTYNRLQPHRDATQFVGTVVEPVANAMHKVLTTPGPREVANLYRKYRDGVFHFDSKWVEQTPQYGQLARTARKEVGMTRRQFKAAVAAQDPVIIDLIKGLRNPDTVDRWAKKVESVFGNWGKNSPEARRFLTTWAPFWQWARSAMKFALVTLPKDHPMLTAMIAASEQMTREEREKLGFSFFADEPLPSWMQGSVPDPFGAPGGVAKVTNLTTFGVFADPTGFASHLVLPQFSGTLMAGMGLDWKGDRLTKADGTPASPLERAKAALFSFGEGLIPFMNAYQSATSKGAAAPLTPIKTYPASTVQTLREPRQQISVPVTGGGGGGSSNPFLGGSESSSSSGNPFLGESSSSSSSSSNPFLK